ncbi:MAG: carotenoid oxygenase family protein [Proteobacteria bacterium]|nr:carotenoid oxygenase family protein [Pseudomonadota bacterium]
MADHEFIFERRTEDLDLALTVEGTLPASLAGTFYAMAPTGCRVGSTPLHVFDAHGRVIAVRIADGQASLRARMVQSPLWEAERDAPAIVKRRLFVNKPSRWSNLFDVDLANPVSHNVVPWGKDLVAANDPGFFRLDPVTLETRGPTTFNPTTKGATLGPMPRVDPATGHHVVFEHRPGRRDTLIVREVDDAFATVVERTYKLDRGGASFHDVAITEHYYLVMQFGTVSLPTLLWGGKPVIDALRFDPVATPRLYLLPRAGGAPIAVPLPGGRLHFHFWNAYEADGKVVADAIGYAGRVDFASLVPPSVRDPRKALATPASSSWRYTIDLATRTAQATALTDVATETPEIRADRRGRAYQFGWAPVPGVAGDEPDRGNAAWYHALARHDFAARTVQTWDAGPRAYVSPAAFVPRPGSTVEDDGHVLALVQDVGTRTATLGVFDARDVAAGPVARLTGAGLLGAINHVAFAIGHGARS